LAVIIDTNHKLILFAAYKKILAGLYRPKKKLGLFVNDPVESLPKITGESVESI